jgi:RHS repeat-associated protein
MKIRFVPLSSALLVAVSLCTFAKAQGPLPAPQFGLVPSATYETYNIDSVNMDTGNNVIKMPLFSLPQLGKLSLSFYAIGNTTSLQPEQSCSSDGSSCGEYYANEWPMYGVSSEAGTNFVGPVIAVDNMPSVTSTWQFTQSCPNNDTDCASTSWFVIDGSGASYPLYYDANALTQMRTTDGSGFLFQSGQTAPWARSLGGVDNSTTGPEVVYDSLGNKFTLPTYGISNNYVESDSDNNTITISGSITDSVGRTIPALPPMPSPNYTNTVSARCPNLVALGLVPATQGAQSSTEWDVPGINGQQVAYTICYTTVAIRTNFWGYGQHYNNYQTCCIDSEGDGYSFSEEEDYEDASAIQSIVLPDGTYWGFVYDGGDPSNYNDVGEGPPYNPNYPGGYVTGTYGTMTKVLLPGGGSIAYTYSLGTNTQCYPVDPYFGSWSGSTTPTIAGRTVADNNGNSYSWTYSIAGQGLGATNTAIDPYGNETDYAYQTNGYCGTDLEKKEYRRQGNGSSATLLRTIAKTYVTTAAPVPYPQSPNYPPYGNPVPYSVTTTPDRQQFSSLTSTLYAGSFSAEMPTCEFYYNTGSHSYVCPLLTQFNQPINLTLSIPQSVSTTDYSGSIIKTTYTAFQWQSNSNYLAANLLATPSSVTTYDGSNSQLSQTGFTFDESTYSTCGTCGHVTSVTQWLNTNPSASPTSHFGWTHGALAFSIDPDQHLNANGHTADYVYPGGSTPTFPYPTSAIDALNETTIYSWDFDTGYKLSDKDPNGNITSYTYDCPAPPYNCSGMIKDIQYPGANGGSANYTYSADTAPTSFPHSITSATAMGGGQYVTKVSLFDGLNRVVQTQLADPVGPSTDYVSTTYDAFDNVTSVTNPFRSTSDPTYGVTSYEYDALNRKTLQIQQDGTSKMSWCYDGVAATNGSIAQTNCHASDGGGSTEWVDFADEGLNDWQRHSDALGRLTILFEPGGLQTQYGYDPLGNLLNVYQLGASGDTQRTTRAFGYNSLSQLTSATNGESGTTSYSYDANGNMVKRVTPAPNSTTAGTTTTIGYSYDGLNRICYKFYTTPTSTCPSSPPSSAVAGYWYASSPNSNITNAVGRLINEETLSNGSVVSQRSPTGYDTVGRLLGEQQCPLGACSTIQYTYDEMGDLTSVTNGLTGTDAVTVGYAYDAAGRLCQVTSPNVPSSCAFSGSGTTLFNATSYGPTALLQAKLGPTSTSQVVSMTRTYDERLRPLSEADAGAGSSTLYSYTIPASNGYLASGNLNTYTDFLMGQWTFAYDSLNRLTSGSASTGVYAGDHGCWAYDDFGNRQKEAFSSVTSTPCAQGANDNLQLTTASYNANNQSSSLSYDIAGNVTNDGTNQYYYDSEGRLCAVANHATGQWVYSEYVYGPEGQRVAKGTISNLSCPVPTSGNGFSLKSEFLLNESDQQLTELGVSAAPQHTNVWAGSKLLATYDFVHTGIHYVLTDWLGTKRVQVSGSGSTFGTAELNCYGLPFGNDFGNTLMTDCVPVGSGSDATEHHFTGKARDTESGNDYFGARYYGSSMGRFLSPDPLLSSGVPTDPQTWNRYSYGLNNPLRAIDPTGLYTWDQSAGGDMSDDDLAAIDKKDKRYKWAQNALSFRNDFRNAWNAASDAAGKLGMADQTAALQGLNAYGFEGENNGVTVGTQMGYGAGTILHDDGTTSVTFGKDILGKSDFLAATVGHEGVHVAQGDAWLAGGRGSVADLNHYFRESAAWDIGAKLAQALGMKVFGPLGSDGSGTPRDYQVWNKGWKAADVETMRSKGIANILTNLYHASPSDTDTFSSEHPQ